MATTRKSCVIKRVEIIPQRERPFSDMLSEAVRLLPAADSRRMEIVRGSGRYRLLNDFTPALAEGLSVSGSVCAFTMDANMNSLTLLPGAGSYPVNVLCPPNRTAEQGEEFVEGIAWFCARGDFLAVLSSRAILGDVLEGYFSWLATEASRRGAETSGEADYTRYAVRLIDPVRPDMCSYGMRNLKGIHFRGGMETRMDAGTNTRQPSGRGTSSVKGLFEGIGEDIAFPVFSGITSDTDLADVKVDVKVTVPSRRADGVAGLVLSKMAEALQRSRSGLDGIEFEFSDGRRLDAASLKVTHELSIQTENGLPSGLDAVRKLDEWMQNQIRLLRNQ